MQLGSTLIKCLFFLSAVCLTGNVSGETLNDVIIQNVKACVEHDDNIKNKAPVYDLIRTLEQAYTFTEIGNDDLRIKFVAAQSCFEHILTSFLASEDIQDLIGIIHTPTIATPLCVKPEGPFDSVLGESIRDDKNKLLTVLSRAHTVREFAKQGGQLFIVYPKEGEKKRNAAELSIYQEELDNYPDQLFDSPLTTNQLDPDLIGATYLFKDKSGSTFAFSIKARQAIDNQPNAEWGLWLGGIQEPVVAERIKAILDYLKGNGGPKIPGYSF